MKIHWLQHSLAFINLESLVAITLLAVLAGVMFGLAAKLRQQGQPRESPVRVTSRRRLRR